MQFGALLYQALPALPYDEKIWGRQLVTDEEDNVLDKVEKLLTGAVSLTLAEAAALCRRMAACLCPPTRTQTAIPFSPCWAAGPMDVDFELFEVKFPQRAEKLIAAGLLPRASPCSPPRMRTVSRPWAAA